MVSAAGDSPAAVFAATSRPAVVPGVYETVPPLPALKVPAFSCGGFGAEAVLPPNRRRRLGRLQQMSLVAAKQCWASGFDGRQSCVAIGTGLGSGNEAAAFVENMLRKDEAEPLPQRFTNAVHNALAAQVAIELGAKGLNSTPTCHEISFEAALWHAGRELAAGPASVALAGAADELNQYAVTAGARWVDWPGPGRGPGEGAAVFALAGVGDDRPPLAYLETVRTGRRAATAAAEAQWIATTLADAGLAVDDVDVFLTGAGGWPGLDPVYAAVADALGKLGSRPVAGATYKQWCGEHGAASAFGFLIALGLLAGQVRFPGAASGCAPCGRVALYTLATGGQKALCCVAK